jgi:hypothetical protein
MSGPLMMRGGSELSPGDFNSPQTGGLLTGIMGGSRKRSGSKRSGSKRSGSKRRGSRKLRGGNSCQMKAGMAPMGMSGGNLITPPGGGGRKSRSRSSLRKPLVLPRYGGGGKTRRLRKHSGKARRHRTKSYSA